MVEKIALRGRLETNSSTFSNLLKNLSTLTLYLYLCSTTLTQKTYASWSCPDILRVLIQQLGALHEIASRHCLPVRAYAVNGDVHVQPNPLMVRRATASLSPSVYWGFDLAQKLHRRSAPYQLSILPSGRCACKLHLTRRLRKNEQLCLRVNR